MYLAIYRVSTFSNCFGPQGIGPPVHTRNYQGLALLDEHLDIIPGTDTVVDVNYWVLKLVFMKSPRHPRASKVSFTVGNVTYHVPNQHFTDCRLAVMPVPTYPGHGRARKTDPKDGIYMTCNNFMAPIAVHRTLDKSMPSEDALRLRSPNAHILPNEFGDGLRFSVLNVEASISNRGKNFNIIRGNKTNYFVEYHPLGPHVAFPIHFEHHRKGFFHPVHKDKPSIVSTAQEPAATWLEPETFRHYPFLERDRGSGCCVEISNDNTTVLIGISHTRTIDQGLIFHHQYVSRLYAMEPFPPFNIVAKTGFFCLGYGKSDENRGNVQVGFNEKLLQINKKGKKYKCPAISFVSSLSEHATNSSLAIISYGVNDCYPRMIAVEKAELTSMLFPK